MCLNATDKYNNGQTAIQGEVAADLGAYRVDLPHDPPAKAMQRNRHEPSVNPPAVNQIYPSLPPMHPSNQIQGVMADGTQHALSFMPLSSGGPRELPPGPSCSTMERDPLISSFSHQPSPGPSSNSAAYSGKGIITTVKSSGGLTVISRKVGKIWLFTSTESCISVYPAKLSICLKWRQQYTFMNNILLPVYMAL